MKVLLAEDTPTQAALIKLSLKKMGYTVVLARDGIEAIEMAYSELPDLIVSDVVMPRLDGYKVCRLLKDDSQMAGIPVILLTSLTQKQDMFWGLKSGADKYLTKEGDIPNLVENIKQFATKWFQDVEPGEERAKKQAPSGDIEFDVMERVVQLLENKLFESTVVNEIQKLLNTLDDYKKTVVKVLEIISKVIDFQVGCVYLVGDEGPDLHLYVNRSVPRSFINIVRDKTVEELAISHGIDPLIQESDETVVDPGNLLSDSEAEPDLNPARPSSIHFTTLYTSGHPNGVIALASATEKAFGARALQTFNIIARPANIVIDYARLYYKNKQLSITDGLTKLYNHRYFQECLKVEFERSARNDKPMSLVMLDIDHFKLFNDNYGHQQGDVVLRTLSRVFQEQVRCIDVVTRYGGEEFAIIMPESDNEVALQVAERLRRKVQTQVIPGPDEDLRVSVSLGVATVPHPEISNYTNMISYADQALYRAKERGRNRVEC